MTYLYSNILENILNDQENIFKKHLKINKIFNRLHELKFLRKYKLSFIPVNLLILFDLSRIFSLITI